ncbi:hypothetical protein BN1723_001176 [Verticillium longisporum]|uniref:Heterokaryon incompatibility domain-containing protein n=1 Tax=Verticillium longisporum TaxID=100787 RepID=A0A0G4M4D5_VERLO|nr:hypothetical protein BN1708_015432 [Verticillium longisporum]CRK46901.1 hypothetical protein BN1723_001176 [Verticillium longisporum]
MSFFEDRLCPICANLNIESLFDPTRFSGLPPAPSPESEAVRCDRYIQHAATWRLPSCPFCEIVGGIGHLLAAGRPLNPDSHTPRETKKVLLAIQSDLLYDIATSRREQHAMNAATSVFLLIMDQVQYDEAKAKSFGSTTLFVRFAHRDFPGSLVSLVANPSVDLRRPLDLPMQGRRLLEETIDYDFVRSWIQLCVDQHENCRRKGNLQPVPRLKLIDCEARRIIKPDPNRKYPYVALSYAWESAPPEKYNYPNLPDHLPPVILDTMRAVVKL